MNPGPRRNNSPPPFPAAPSRRAVLCGGALASLAAAGTTARAGTATARAEAQAGTARPGTAASTRAAESAQTMSAFGFNTGWLFGGEYTAGSEAPGYDDSGFTPVTLPHTVTPLSWGQWDPTAWQKVWIYRKHFARPALRPGDRVFADFDGVMTSATVVLNGRVLTAHQGGYLPWSTELAGGVTGGRSVMALIVDSRWLPVPPDGASAGAGSVDYLQPGGIYRDVTLRVVPGVFLSDVFVRPVLGPGRSVAVQATIDAAAMPAGPVRVTAELRDATAVLGTGSALVTVTGTGTTVAGLSITGIGGVTPWSPDLPQLYTVRVMLDVPGGRPHTAEVRTGFREAVFRDDGFYLNGERRQIFGLNRHQLFPYTGMAAAARLQRRDAEILKFELNCNMVRCSHYPQSPHFLDACDELGLMVWQEAPGWQYVGGPAWRDLVVDNVRDMVVRDRSRPSVILWGTRLNETADHPGLYTRTRQAAEDLDGTRQTTGATFRHSAAGWDADVFGYDDYHGRDSSAELEPPLPGLPYLVSEAVGAMDGPPAFRWIDTGAVLAEQARMHAQVHNIARADPRYAGLLGWAAIDYASLNGGIRIWDTLKTPGVLDTFRVPKPGAAFYRSQRDPLAGPVILPAFFWDFGPGSPRHGPGLARHGRHQLRPARDLRRRRAPGHGDPRLRGLRLPGLPAGVRGPPRGRVRPAGAAHRRLRRRPAGHVGPHVGRHLARPSRAGRGRPLDPGRRHGHHADHVPGG